MMQNYHSHGRPLNVLNFTEGLEDTGVKDQLATMFEHPDVKNRQIVAFSVVGPYRKGKSLFLNYCLRYLYAHFQSINFMNNPMSNSKRWMGTDDEPLVGFSWRSGSDPDTKGIVFWNDVFLYTNENGEQIAIVVIDSQGLFNSDSSQLENSRIFALGTLISSIQVFNLSGVVQEDQLQYLQFAADYAKFSLSKNCVDEKPFQKLFFLIRDWDNPQEYPFGCVGGEKYLQRFFNSKANKTDELKSVYEYINSLYQHLSCSLLPNPGKVVSQGISKLQNEKYDGSLSGMDEDFKEELVKVIEEILSPEKLILKRFDGKCLNGAEFLDHMLHYFNFYLTNKIPEVQTVLESMVQNEMKPLILLCIDKYKDAFRKVQNNLTNLDQMQKHHEECKETVLILFKDSIKIGNTEDELKYKLQLVEQIDEIYREHIKQFEINEKKIEEENNKLRNELKMKHEQELEEIKRQIEAQRKKNDMEIQKMKDEFEQKKKSMHNEITHTTKQKEKINEQYNWTPSNIPKDFDSKNHLYNQNMHNAQGYQLQYRNSPETSLQKQHLYSQSTFVDNNNEFFNNHQRRLNQSQKDLVSMNEQRSTNPFIPNKEFTRGRSLTSEKSLYMSPVQQVNYNAQLQQNNQIQCNGPAIQHISKTETCAGSNNFPDQYKDIIDEAYNQQNPFQQFDQYDQQNDGKCHNYNQNIMPTLTQSPPENKNMQPVEQYNNGFEIPQSPERLNNDGVQVFEEILSPEKLILKRFDGKCGAEFLDHMLHYFNFYLTNKIPEVQTVLESMVQNEMKPLILLCIDKYKDAFRKVQNQSLDQMQKHHEECKETVLILFKDSIKIGNTEDELKYKLQLVEQIDEIYREHIKQFEINEKKIEEENNKLRNELKMKHEQELEEIKRQLEAQRKKNDMEIQKMKDEFEQKKKSIHNEITHITKQKEKQDRETETTSIDQVQINEQYNWTPSEDESIKSGDYDNIPKDFDSKNHLYNQNMYNTQGYQLKYRNSPKTSLQKQHLYSQSTFVDNNNEFFNNHQRRLNQSQKDLVSMSSYEQRSTKPFIPNKEFTRGRSLTSEKSLYMSPVQQVNYNAQLQQNNQIQCNGPAIQHISKTETCAGSNNFPDQYKDIIDEAYNQQDPFQQFDQYDQQNDGKCHNYNQNIMPTLTQSPPENKNMQPVEQYNNGFEIPQSPERLNNDGGPYEMNQSVNYGKTYEKSFIKMQNSNFNPQNPISRMHSVHQTFGSSEMYSFPNQNLCNDRERSGNANKNTFIEQSQANERKLQEGRDRINRIKAQFLETSQREKEEYEEELRQRSLKKNSSTKSKGWFSFF